MEAFNGKQSLELYFEIQSKTKAKQPKRYCVIAYNEVFLFWFLTTSWPKYSFFILRNQLLKACNYFTNFIFLNYIFPCLLKLRGFERILCSFVICSCFMTNIFSLDHFFFTDDSRVVSFTHAYSSLPAAVAQHFSLLSQSAIPEALPPLLKGSALALMIELLWCRQIPYRHLYKWKQVVYSSFLWDTFQMWSLGGISKAVHATVWKMLPENYCWKHQWFYRIQDAYEDRSISISNALGSGQHYSSNNTSQ